MPSWRLSRTTTPAARPEAPRRTRTLWSTRRGLVAAAALAVALPAAVTLAGAIPVGPSHHTPGDWALTPAGQQVTLGDFPMNGVLSPDGRYLVVTNDGQGTQSLQVLDVGASGVPKVVQTLPYTAPEALYLGLAFSPDGKTLYASAGGNNKIRVYRFADGVLSEQAPIPLPVGTSHFSTPTQRSVRRATTGPPPPRPTTTRRRTGRPTIPAATAATTSKARTPRRTPSPASSGTTPWTTA